MMTVTSLFIDMAGIFHVSAASLCSLKSSYLTLPGGMEKSILDRRNLVHIEARLEAPRMFRALAV